MTELPDAENLQSSQSAVTDFERVPLGKKVTVGIAAYGNYETTRTCLECLFLSCTGDYELLLVDDCSPDQGKIRSLFLAARTVHPTTSVLSFDRNLEYSGSLNAILSHAKGELVLFLSNDVFTTPAYLRTLIEVAGDGRESGVIRGCSNFVDNGLPSHNVGAPKGQSIDDLFSFAQEIEETRGGQTSIDEYLTGDAFIVSRAVIDKIGTFDPLFYGYFADHDFGLRAQIAGFDLVLACGAYAFHQRAANFDYLPQAQRELKLAHRWARVHENWARFKLKYHLPAEASYEGTNLIPWAELRHAEFSAAKHYTAPGDYSRYVLGPDVE
jgi:GT2 family glycosyltransferase